ncbi:hypothetical protein KSF73_07645 [Burkholderiaceae bacterium DAT-1]|nr:hypothetical protein [Burkholderiaceae bacterium DAT-1]
MKHRLNELFDATFVFAIGILVVIAMASTLKTPVNLDNQTDEAVRVERTA